MNKYTSEKQIYKLFFIFFFTNFYLYVSFEVINIVKSTKQELMKNILLLSLYTIGYGFRKTVISIKQATLEEILLFIWVSFMACAVIFCMLVKLGFITSI